ncbi:GNAT family N-acetyltransferase [Undibacterium sp. JH2W]|uniref:GNAT family N-acetyltransferase n=1 Tax=Undibacterium sp. JH2W TaxID=3413037 RepID=UPI003BF1AFAD
MYKLPGTLKLREVSGDDQSFLDVLYASRREDLRQMPMDAAFISKMIKMQQHVQMEGIRMNFPEAVHFIIEDAGQRAGRIIIDTGETDLRLIDIAIAPHAQRQGIARIILNAMQLEAQGKDIGISLAVEQTNFVARGLYLQMGFVVHSADHLFEQMHWRGKARAAQDDLHDALPASHLDSINFSLAGQCNG